MKHCVLYQLTIVCLLVALSRSECSSGCLKCSSADPEKSSCLLCDFKGGFALNDQGSCEKKTAANCEILNFKADSSDCFRCRPAFRLDAQTLKCEEIPSENLHPNCKYYDSNGACEECEPNFVVDAGKCRDLLEKAVENCSHYVDDKCVACLGGLRFDGEKCVSFDDNIEGCGVFTDLECIECATGYQKDFLRSAMSVTNALTEEFLRKCAQIDPSKKYFKQDISNVCFKKEHINCLESADSKTCNKCLPGHYPVSSQKCDPNPADAILECAVYRDLKTCLTCKPGFYLSANECSKATEVPFCSEYHSTEDKCVSCKSSDNLYFISGGACEPRVNSKEKCFEYSPSKDECVSCDNTKMFKENNLCSQRKQVESCEEYSQTKNECSKCLETHRLTDDNLKCLSKIAFCKTYQNSTEQTEKFVCDACEDSHYTQDNESCLEKKIDNCQQLKTGNLNECQLCNESFYLDETDKTCKSQSVTNCQTFTSNTNDCSTCEDLFYLNVKDCSPIDPTLNCLHSDGKNNTCTDCAGDRFLNEGSCELRKNPHDSRCVANRGSLDDSSCTKCQEYDSIATTSQFVVSQEEMNTLFCAQLSLDEGNCVQCAENAEALTGQVCQEASNKNSDCLQLIPEVFEVLGNNINKCAKCRNYDTHFLHLQGTCISRQKYTPANCKKLSLTSDSCLGFEPEMTVHKNAKIGHCVSMGSQSLPEIENCLYYDSADLTKCAVCNIGNELSEDSTECLKSTIMVTPFMNQLGDFDYPEITPQSPGFVANCRNYSYDKFNHKLLCHKCVYGYSNIVDFESETVVASNYNYTGQNFSSEFPIKECVLTLKPYQDAEKVDLIPKEFCKFYNYSSQTDSHECVQCSSTYQAVYSVASFHSDGTTEANNKNIISSCESGEFSYLKDGFGFHLIGEPELPHLYMLSNTSCTNEGFKLVVFLDIKTLPNRTIEIPDISTGVAKNSYKCLLNVTNSVSENCGVHWSPGISSIVLQGTQTASKCLACLPKFKPLIDVQTKEIIGCEPIENCSSSFVFNACSLCNEGFFSPFDDSIKAQDLTQCVSKGTNFNYENCIYYAIDKCFLCNPGFIFNNKGECIENPEKSNNNCNRENLVSMKITEIENQQQYHRFTFNVLNNFRPYIVGCRICSSQFRLVTTLDSSAYSESSLYPGTEWITNMTLKPIPGCKIRKEFNSEKCTECETGFLLKEDDFTCVSAESVAQSHPNCKSLQTIENQLKCASCAETHLLNDQTKMCDLEHNCELYWVDTNANIDGIRSCSLCKENTKIKKDNPLMCEPFEDANEVCLQFNNEGHCLKCKEAGEVPINYLNITSKTYTYKCISFSLENIPKFVENKFMFGVIYREDNLEGTMFKLITIPNEGNKGRIVIRDQNSILPFEGQVNKSVCVPFENNEHCKIKIPGKCFECNEEYFLDPQTSTCKEGEISGCLVYTDKTNCDTCEKDYLKNGSNQCIEREAENCLKTVNRPTSARLVKRGTS